MPKKDIAHLSSLVKFFYMCSSNAININTDYHKLDDDNSNNNGATTITGSTTTMTMTRGRNTEHCRNHDERAGNAYEPSMFYSSF